MPSIPAAAPKERWTLLRNARQLLTLRGPSGPRRGLAMSDLNIVPNGALLIRNGIIEDVGPARRVENLAGARHAREIDATGRVVMPAFVEADLPLITPPSAHSDGTAHGREDSAALRLMSKKRVLERGAAMAAECARYGCLTAGAHTRCATDLQNIGKVLRVHQALQQKPLRIRSIFSPRFPPGDSQSADNRMPSRMLEMLISRWLPAVRARKLSSVVELNVGDPDSLFDASMLRTAAVAAAGLGYAIRLRSLHALEPVHLQLALAAGVLGIVAPVDSLRAFDHALAAIGCVRIVPASEGFDDPGNAGAALRLAIDDGSAIAISSSYRAQGASTLNMQHLLHIAVENLRLTTEEAITATTWNPACSLRLSHVTGSLEPGKSADLLVMDVPDYHELPRRAGHLDASVVMRAGQIVAKPVPLNAD